MNTQTEVTPLTTNPALLTPAKVGALYGGEVNDIVVSGFMLELWADATKYVFYWDSRNRGYNLSCKNIVNL